MNVTIDLEGNLLFYYEFSVTNITTDENNYYIKKTNLIDETDKTYNLDAIKYKKSLDNLLYHLEQSLKEDIKFTAHSLVGLYNTIHKNENLVSYKKKDLDIY